MEINFLKFVAKYKSWIFSIWNCAYRWTYHGVGTGALGRTPAFIDFRHLCIMMAVDGFYAGTAA